MKLRSSAEWQLKGVGNANAVFAYAGSDAALVGKVLRVKKVRRSTATDGAEALEDEIWSTMPSLSGQVGGTLEEAYVTEVMRPRLGHKFVAEQVAVQLQPQLAAGLLQQLQAYGMQHVQNAVLSSAFLLLDHTLLPCNSCSGVEQPSSGLMASWEPAEGAQEAGFPTNSGSEQHHPVVCIEIKPKCGFLPTAATIHPQHNIKRQQSRFQLQQALKLAQGQVAAASRYDPLDLFSGDQGRRQQALRCLLQCPQNNLRIFVEGTQLDPSKFGSALQSVFGAVADSQASEQLVLLVCSILCATGVLDSILAVQKLDRYDIEGVYAIYQQLLGNINEQHFEADLQPALSSCAQESVACSAEEGQGNQPAVQEYQQTMKSILNLPHNQALAVLRDYLIAATAKDCSIMIAFRNDEGNAVHSCGERIEAAGSMWRFHIAIVDLDMKSLQKLDTHMHLDQQILAAVAAERQDDVTSTALS